MPVDNQGRTITDKEAARLESLRQTMQAERDRYDDAVRKTEAENPEMAQERAEYESTLRNRAARQQLQTVEEESKTDDLESRIAAMRKSQQEERDRYLVATRKTMADDPEFEGLFQKQIEEVQVGIEERHRKIDEAEIEKLFPPPTSNAQVQSTRENRVGAEKELANTQASSDSARSASQELQASKDPNAPCPCDGPLTPAQKALHAAGLSLKNPVGAAAAGTASKLAGSLNKVNNLRLAMADPTSNLFGVLNGIGGGKIDSLFGSVQSMANSVNALKAEADRLSDPATLMTTLGTMNLYGKIGCALGIEGLDISVALQASSEGGINKIAAAAAAQVDLDKILDGVLEGANLVDGANALSSGIDGVMGGIGSAIGGMNDVVGAGQAAMAEAMAKVAEFAQINFFANLVGDAAADPCNALAIDIKANILSPEFTKAAESALSSVKVQNIGSIGVR